MGFIHVQETVAIKLCSDYSFKVTQQYLHVAMCLVVFNETGVPLTLVGYEMITAKAVLQCMCLADYLSSPIQCTLME